MFIIAIVEHESQVNFKTSFKMLQYITLVLTEYEKEVNKATHGISSTKGFKFPPVIPIVFYDGVGEWTAEFNFLDKTELSVAFEKYIPKFEYELVNLDEYSEQDIMDFGNTLSMIMLMDKVRTADGLNIFGKLPVEYVDKLSRNIPAHLNKLLSDVITILLKRVNVPDEEIGMITQKLYMRRIQEMFAFIDNYDVQETRRIARVEGHKEGLIEGRLEEKRRVILEMKKEGIADTVIAKVVKLPLEQVVETV